MYHWDRDQSSVGMLASPDVDHDSTTALYQTILFLGTEGVAISSKVHLAVTLDPLLLCEPVVDRWGINFWRNLRVMNVDATNLRNVCV